MQNHLLVIDKVMKFQKSGKDEIFFYHSPYLQMSNCFAQSLQIILRYLGLISA